MHLPLCMSDDASADGGGGGGAINDLFKHDRGIMQARRNARKAEAKCRLLLKRCLKQGDVRFCNSCISSFANDGMLGLALVIVREVFEKGKHKPSEYADLPPFQHALTSPLHLRYTLSNVVNACIRCSEVDRAMHHWHQLRALGAPANEVTYTALFKGLCGSNRLDDALALLADMQTAGLRPNERTFSTLMRGCMRDARGDAAQAVLLQMQHNDITPDGACVEYAVKALVYDGDMKAAGKLCKLYASSLTAAAAVVLATGWVIAGKAKKVRVCSGSIAGLRVRRRSIVCKSPAALQFA
jgi:pentatricopeptide repeat protein